MPPEAAAGGHETRDARVGLIALVGAGLVGLAAVIHVVLYFQMEGLWHARQAEEVPAVPTAAALPAEPPEPRLQTAPALDLQALRAEEDARLGSYGWVDRDAGLVHVPIARAMAMAVAEAER
jgi:hypothetical protein